MVTIVVLSLIKVSSLETANEEYNKTIFRLTQINTNLQNNYDALLNNINNQTTISIQDELPSIKSLLEMLTHHITIYMQ